MHRLRGFAITIMILSFLANGWLGFHLYKNNQVLQMEAASYDDFKLSLREAIMATDAVKTDKSGSMALKFDTNQANMDLQRAIGTIWGLRTDFAKKGMDIYPIFNALIQSENFSPYDPKYADNETQNVIYKNSKTLHDLYSTLAPTSFTNTGLKQLKQAVSSFYGKYSGYPSYSQLQ